MPNDIDSSLTDAEERLRRAILASDLAALDELIAPELVFTSHLGQVFGKDDDLATHRSGQLRLTRMEPSEMRIQPLGECAVVTVRMAVAGSFGPARFGADLRYTRLWRRGPGGGWQVAAAHASEVR